jgi:hypothetical protein
LPERPASLEAPGVRVGGEWLVASTPYPNVRSGLVSQIVRREGSGELVIIGSDAAVFLPRDGGLPRVVGFVPQAGHAELLEWPGELPRFVDSGGGGWQLGGLYGPEGRRLWQPDQDAGMDDLAAGDVDGDGIPEFVVGYNGGGGIRLLDAARKERWRQADANVWHVEVLDTDGDGKAEIVHSNAAGQLTVREASGEVRRRVHIEGYLADFSVVRWPPTQLGLLHAADSHTEIVDFDGKARARLNTPDTSRLGQARAVATRFADADHLALAVSQRHWDRSQLFVFDASGARVYHEVLPGQCVALAASDPNALLLGCGERVLRYEPRARPQG